MEHAACGRPGDATQGSLEQAVLPLVAPAATQQGGLGSMAEAGWQHTLDLVARVQHLDQKPPVASLYSTDVFARVAPSKVWGKP